MNSHVIYKTSFMFESVSALRAAERLFLTMNSHMIIRLPLLFESISAQRAAERLFDVCCLNAATH